MEKSMNKGVVRAYEVLAADSTLCSLADTVLDVFERLERRLRQGATLYLCGNGGSLADAMHISGELLKSFVLPRPVDSEMANALSAQEHGKLLSAHLQRGIRSHVLGLNPALSSAVVNDIQAPGIGYAQELYALASSGDVFLGISTSGKALNVRLVAETAHAMGLLTVGLTGGGPNPLADLVALPICVPETETYRVQELHIIIYHQLCLMLEAAFFESGPSRA
jgi:D-sedoheptulose 7-phosphate isomerase